MRRFRTTRTARSALLLGLVLTASVFMPGGTANAAVTPLGLGTATSFAIRAGSGITNTGAGTSITGDIGNSPGAGTQITGLTCVPAQVVGTIYQVSAGGPAPCTVTDPLLMTTVENDARTAFNFGSALPGATPLPTDLAGQSLVSGLYSFGAAATNLTGTLTLDAQGDPNAAWIFQASSTLITSPGSTVQIINAPAGSQLACNVYWTVGSSATIDTTTTFVGTVLASASITVNNGAAVTGRLLAGNQASGEGAVTLISDTIIRPTGCATLPAGPGGPSVASPTPVVAPPAFTG